jgi:hypothetical protein
VFDRLGITERLSQALASDSGCSDFLIHGDYWANNMMFDKNNDCKVVDWQFVFVCCQSVHMCPLVAYFSMKPEETERHKSDFFLRPFQLTCEALRGIKGKVRDAMEQRNLHDHGKETRGSSRLHVDVMRMFVRLHQTNDHAKNTRRAPRSSRDRSSDAILRTFSSHIGHEDSVGLSVCEVHIYATRWRIYT